MPNERARSGQGLPRGPYLQGVPVIVLSMRDEPEAKLQAFAAGANDYLVKLPDRLEMLARIRYHSSAYLAQRERNRR